MSRPQQLKDGRKFYRLIGRPHRGRDENGNMRVYTRDEWVPLTDQQYKAFGDVFSPTESASVAEDRDARIAQQARLDLAAELRRATRDPHLAARLQLELAPVVEGQDIRHLVPPYREMAQQQRGVLNEDGTVSEDATAADLTGDQLVKVVSGQLSGLAEEPTQVERNDGSEVAEPLPDGWRDLPAREKINLARSRGAGSEVNSGVEAVSWLTEYEKANAPDPSDIASTEGEQ